MDDEDEVGRCNKDSNTGPNVSVNPSPRCRSMGSG